MAIDLPILLRAYSLGMFPMADDRRAQSIFWVEPEMRAIMPLDGFHLSRSLRKVIRSDRFQVTRDEAFEQVIALCAESAIDRPSTWINREIEEAFIRLHNCGLAHSVEVWSHDDDGERQLVGGLYGLAIGRLFCGESMFSRATDASKVAMAWLVARLRVGGYKLLDCQFMTSHLASLGAIEISAADYSVLLGAAVGGGAAGADGAGAASFEALDSFVLPEDALPEPRSGERTVSGPVSGHVIAQLITQTS